MFSLCVGDTTTFEPEIEAVQEDPQPAEFHERCADDVK